MFNRRALLVMAVCAVLTSSTAFAGGGGTKKDATITFRNDAATPIAVFVDLKVALPANPTQAQIEAAGGKIVNPGKDTSFKVSAGTYTLSASDGASPAQLAGVAIGKGKTKKFAYAVLAGVGQLAEF